MTTRTGARVYRRAPKPLKAGACATCGRDIALTSTGRRRRHRDKAGRSCTGGGVFVGDAVTPPADVLANAEIVIPPARTWPTRAAAPKARKGSSGLPATGYCHDCDRPVTGERRYCGPCAAARMSRRAS